MALHWDGHMLPQDSPDQKNEEFKGGFRNP